MIAIADSGSTKCQWAVLDLSGNELSRFQTRGFNPYFHSPEEISNTLLKAPGCLQWSPQITEVHFYGAGCSTTENCQQVKSGLKRIFVQSKIFVGHDLLAAARSAYNGKPVVACILGTGSNACLYDGKKLKQSVPSLGYILGDEGSGSWLGRQLLNAYFYGKLPKAVARDFESTFNVKLPQILDRLFNQPHPNTFLASFAPFVEKHKKEEALKNIITEGFAQFFAGLAADYPKDIPHSFTGSVAWYFKSELAEATHRAGRILGEISQEPMDGLVRFHT